MCDNHLFPTQCSVTSHWWFNICQGGSIYTMGIRKCYKSGLGVLSCWLSRLKKVMKKMHTVSAAKSLSQHNKGLWYVCRRSQVLEEREPHLEQPFLWQEEMVWNPGQESFRAGVMVVKPDHDSVEEETLWGSCGNGSDCVWECAKRTQSSLTWEMKALLVLNGPGWWLPWKS